MCISHIWMFRWVNWFLPVTTNRIKSTNFPFSRTVEAVHRDKAYSGVGSLTKSRRITNRTNSLTTTWLQKSWWTAISKEWASRQCNSNCLLQNKTRLQWPLRTYCLKRRRRNWIWIFLWKRRSIQRIKCKNRKELRIANRKGSRPRDNWRWRT